MLKDAYQELRKVNLRHFEKKMKSLNIMMILKKKILKIYYNH